MKAVAIAIMLALVPAFAFAQAEVTAECPEGECHVVPFFKGSGGFVGKFNEEAMAEGEQLTSVGLIVTCGNINITASVDPADDGTVAHLFTEDNGLACHQDDGEIHIHGLVDGGWYWIHDETNSAVSNLLPDRVLTNVQTAPFDASGGDIEMTSRDYATLVKDTRSGRVGILPHILPAAEPVKCGNMRSGCLLTGDYTVEIKNADDESVKGTTIERGDEDIELTVSIGGEGNIAINPESGGATAVFDVNGPDDTDLPDVYEPAGSTMDVAEFTLTIPAVDDTVLESSDDPCRTSSQHRDEPTTVVITATNSGNTIPAFTADDGPTAMFSIECSPVPEEASRGGELDPENPFPVD